MSETILAVAAHPDDEALGAGGALARHALAGDRVQLLFLTNGVGARGAQGVEARREAACGAARIIGARPPVILDFPDNRLDSVPLLDVIQAIETAAAPLRPAVVYTHHESDLNVDHRICCQAALTAFRPLPGSPVRAIYGFEVASSTEWGVGGAGGEFRPRRFVDIAATLEVKLQALDAYRQEMRPFPHPRSREAITALARWRGANAGLAAAEAFIVIRERIS